MDILTALARDWVPRDHITAAPGREQGVNINNVVICAIPCHVTQSHIGSHHSIPWLNGKHHHIKPYHIHNMVHCVSTHAYIHMFIIDVRPNSGHCTSHHTSLYHNSPSQQLRVERGGPGHNHHFPCCAYPKPKGSHSNAWTPKPAAQAPPNRPTQVESRDSPRR